MRFSIVAPGVAAGVAPGVAARVVAGALAALILFVPAARAEEPLWTEGPSRGALPPNAPINMQAFVRLARTLGPAIVNIVAIQTGDIGDERPGSGGEKPHGMGR